MTIDEAIAHTREVAERNRNFDVIPEKVMDTSTFKYNCIKCAEEHEQLAEWLEELNVLRHGANELRSAGYEHGYSVGYNNAIDDFAESVKNLIADSSVIRFKDIDEIAEQLKGAKQSEDFK